MAFLWVSQQEWARSLLDVELIRELSGSVGLWIFPLYLGVWVLGGGQIMLPTLAAGVLWGWGAGALMAVLGSAVSGSIYFFVIRQLLRKPVEVWFGARIRPLQAPLEARGLALMVIWRLVWGPAFPLIAAAALCRVRFRDFLLAAPAMLPGALLVTLVADSLALHGWRGVPAERWLVAAALLGGTAAVYGLAVRRWPELRVVRRK